MSRFHPSLIALVLPLLLLLKPVRSVGDTGAVAPDNVVVLVSHEAGPYQQALAGLRNTLSIQVPLAVHGLQGEPERVMPVLQSLPKQSVVVTLGALATQSVEATSGALGRVACLVLDGEAIRMNAHTTGVVLEFPLALQLYWMQRIIPSLKTIGVLYNAQENRQKIAEATLLVRQRGLRLEAREIRTPKDIPGALEALENKVDVLWGLVDSLVVNPQTAKTLLLFSFRQRIPFIGPSNAWVKAGALYALEWDYEDLGRQCGELVLRILQGEQASRIPPQPPRTVRYSLNQRTAEHMHIDFSMILRRDAREIFE